MSADFIRVSNGSAEEIIRAENLIKVYKAEGHEGKAIYYDFVRFDSNVSSWREEYPTVEERDAYFYKLVKLLCGRDQIPSHAHTRYRIEQYQKTDFVPPEDLSYA